MKEKIYIDYDNGSGGDYVAEAYRVAYFLTSKGYKEVMVNDLGYGAEVVYC